MNEWIKLHRDLVQWEWYQDSMMVHLFIHLLLKANHEPGNWQGIAVEPGQLVTGLHSLNKQTGISIKSLRTRLNRLKTAGEVVIESTNRYSIITICKYEQYQIEAKLNDSSSGNPEGKQGASKGQARGKQGATNKNDKNDKNEEEIYKATAFSFYRELLKLGVEDQVAADWIKVRNKKNAASTLTAFKAIKKEIDKAGVSANECIRIAAEKSWRGFKAEWIIEEIKKNESIKRNIEQSSEQQSRYKIFRY